MVAIAGATAEAIAGATSEAIIGSTTEAIAGATVEVMARLIVWYYQERQQRSDSRARAVRQQSDKGAT